MLTREKICSIASNHELLFKNSWVEKCGTFGDTLVFTVKQSHEHLMKIFGSKKITTSYGNLRIRYSTNVSILCIEDTSDATMSVSNFDDAVDIVDFFFLPVYKNFVISKENIDFVGYTAEEPIQDVLKVAEALEVNVEKIGRIVKFRYGNLNFYF